jgi:hypothetical protein
VTGKLDGFITGLAVDGYIGDELVKLGKAAPLAALEPPAGRWPTSGRTRVRQDLVRSRNERVHNPDIRTQDLRRAPELVAMSQVEPRAPYPNVKARLRLSRQAPALPKRETYMDIFMDGSRFRVRDESGAHPSTILGDLLAPGGLGRPPRSLEEIMDINAAWRRTGPVAPRPTDLYGDLATSEGWVRDGLRKEWPLAADRDRRP